MGIARSTDVRAGAIGSNHGLVVAGCGKGESVENAGKPRLAKPLFGMSVFGQYRDRCVRPADAS